MVNSGVQEDLFLVQEEHLLLAQASLAALEPTLVMADRVQCLLHLPAWTRRPLARLGAPPGCPVGRRLVAARWLSTTQFVGATHEKSVLGRVLGSCHLNTGCVDASADGGHSRRPASPLACHCHGLS